MVQIKRECSLANSRLIANYIEEINNNNSMSIARKILKRIFNKDTIILFLNSLIPNTKPQNVVLHQRISKSVSLRISKIPVKKNTSSDNCSENELIPNKDGFFLSISFSEV